MHLENSISRKQRREGINPLEVFHTSLRSTYRQKMGPKGPKHLGKFPRKYISIKKNHQQELMIHIKLNKRTTYERISRGVQAV